MKSQFVLIVVQSRRAGAYPNKIFSTSSASDRTARDSQLEDLSVRNSTFNSNRSERNYLIEQILGGDVTGLAVLKLVDAMLIPSKCKGLCTSCNTDKVCYKFLNLRGGQLVDGHTDVVDSVVGIVQGKFCAIAYEPTGVP